MPAKYTPAQAAMAFLAKIDDSGGPDCCWPWMGATDGAGYGCLTRLGKMQKAHRVAWQYAVGEIPANTLVCHQCDNPPCCNPSHLFLGTQSDNMQDSIRKGRARMTQPEIVTAIYKTKGTSTKQRDVARDYGVSQSLVSQIYLGRKWSGLTGQRRIEPIPREFSPPREDDK